MEIKTPTIGDRIKARRKELGMTQDELARIMGFDGKSNISLIEHGRIEVSVSKLVILANALNTNVNYLLGIPSEESSVKHEELCKAYEQADNETRAVVRRLLGLKRESPYISSIFGS